MDFEQKFSAEQEEWIERVRNRLIVPPPAELGARLGRFPRWVARMRPRWTVLHHSLLVQTLVEDALQHKPARFRDNVQLYALLHDAAEMVTGDIPTPFKDPYIRAIQHAADERIREAYGIPEPVPLYRRLVKAADLRAMSAEAAAFDRGDGMALIKGAKGPWGPPEPGDIGLIDLLLQEYGSPAMVDHPQSAGAIAFAKAVEYGIRRLK